MQLAWLFLLYELAGIVTNLYAGWLAARFGLAATLYAGLVLQIGALVALAQLEPGVDDCGLGGLRHGGAGGVWRGQGSGQDVVEIGGQAAWPQTGMARCFAGWPR